MALAIAPLADGQTLAALARVAVIEATCATVSGVAVAVFADASEAASRAAAGALSRSLRDARVLFLRRGPSDDPAASDIQAAGYVGGEEVAQIAPGLAIAELPAAVEDLLLGAAHPLDLDGAVRSGSMTTWKAASVLTRAA
ncbi:MAG: hypothetical protein LBT54_00700, partial [Bifidobacteriaceae bacterium]|nr:hypothetical protein [Bifidobacteriaceae bacterium]